MAFFYTARAELDHWQARHGHTSDDYQSAFDQLVAEGYRSTWVSGHAIENHPRFEGIWEKVKYPRWITHHGMTASDYESKFNAYVSDQAFRLTLVNGYTVNGVEFYCAIWDQSPSPPWVSKHGLTSSEYQSVSDDLTSQGYVLTHVSGYSVGSDARYAAIWTKTDDDVPWVTRHGLNSADYQAAFDHYVGLGYRLELVCGYAVDGVDLYAGIWRKRPSGPWVARHGITAQEYQAEFDRYASNGYVLRVVSGYNSGEGERYAAIFEKPTYNGADVTFVHSAMTAFTRSMENSHGPRLSLGISHRGRLVYRWSFYVMRKESGIVVTPTVREVAGEPRVNLTTMTETLEPSRPGTKLEAIEYLQTVLINISRVLEPPADHR